MDSNQLCSAASDFEVTNLDMYKAQMPTHDVMEASELFPDVH